MCHSEARKVPTPTHFSEVRLEPWTAAIFWLKQQVKNLFHHIPLPVATPETVCYVKRLGWLEIPKILQVPQYFRSPNISGPPVYAQTTVSPPVFGNPIFSYGGTTESETESERTEKQTKGQKNLELCYSIRSIYPIFTSGIVFKREKLCDFKRKNSIRPHLDSMPILC